MADAETLTLEDFLKEALEPQRHLRAGQSLMISLQKHRPGLYEEILNAKNVDNPTLGIDCFYEDKYLWSCVAWLKDNWEK